MLRKEVFRIFQISSRGYSEKGLIKRGARDICLRQEERHRVEKIAVCGAANPFGKALALLLKLGNCVKSISLYDKRNEVEDVATDLGSVNARCKVVGYSGSRALKTSLENADVVLVLDGWDGLLHRDEDECLNANARVVHDYGLNIANACPHALVCLFSQPLDSVVPLISETLKKCKAYDPRKILAPCSHLETRARAATANHLGLDPASVTVPIVGGTCPFRTCVPLFSRAEPFNHFSEDEIHRLTIAVAESWEECRKLGTPAPLSLAHAAAGFVRDVCAALCGLPGIHRTAYVRSDALPPATYFAGLQKFGRKGIEFDCGLPKMNDYELEMLENALPVLERSVEKGVSAFRRLIREEMQKETEKCVGKPQLIKTPIPDCHPIVPSDICHDCVPGSTCISVP